MNVRAAISVLLSCLALLPSLSEQSDVRVRRKADPPWARPSPANNFYGPPGHGRPGNKFGGQTDFGGNRGHSGGGGPPGLSNSVPPGLAGGTPPGWGHGRPPNYHEYDQERPNTGNPYEEDHGNPHNEDSGAPHVPTTPSPDYQPGVPNKGHGNTKKCKDHEFHCSSGECVPLSVKCNGNSDCFDYSDEANCVTTENRVEEGGCTLPEQPEGGSYTLGGCGTPCSKHPGDKVPRNSILTYTCRDNYILSGNTISVCVNDEWYNPPTCLRTCPPLFSTTVDISCTYKGNIVACNERIKPGTRANLSCKQSYKLPLTNDPGYREITCLEDGLWDRRVFRCLPECGTSIALGNTLIVHGFNAKVGIFPWHVGIYNKKSPTEYEQICGGSLISNNLVVSAAHCFYDEVYSKVRDKSHFAVAAGKYHRDWDANEKYAQKSMVADILLGQRYMGARGNFAEDIALVKLETPFNLTVLVRPVCLDWDNTYEREQLQIGQSGKAVGWGKTILGEASETLQAIHMPFVPYDQCLSAVPDDFRGYITSDKFCAGHLNGSSLCEGDSGGGLCFEKHGVWYLRGIVSVSPVKDDSCDYNSYVGFTYVSHFREWIRDIYVRD